MVRRMPARCSRASTAAAVAWLMLVVDVTTGGVWPCHRAGVSIRQHQSLPQCGTEDLGADLPLQLAFHPGGAGEGAAHGSGEVGA